MNHKKPLIVVLSGGQDSTTCLFWAIEHYGRERVHALTFNYGQKHQREIECARKIASFARVSHEVLSLGSNILVGTSPLVNSSVPLEQYENHQSLPGGIEKTFVPFRNQLFITIALNRLVAIGGFALVLGVCEEDYGGYPDCRHDFIVRLEGTSNYGLHGAPYDDDQGVRLLTPLMKLTKAATVRLAKSLGHDCWYALSHTHTGYDGAYPPTGKDHATLLRAKGFEEAGFPDPLVVRAVAAGLMPLPKTKNYDVVREWLA